MAVRFIPLPLPNTVRPVDLITTQCDVIYAAEDATFGLPEIKIGTIPGAGGTQRLTRVLGKYKAMEFILTGESATGQEFERLGLVTKVFPRHQVVGEALKLAERIAANSTPVAQLAKQAILSGKLLIILLPFWIFLQLIFLVTLTAENTHLDMGMAAERSLYYATFSIQDFREGQAAFLEKRPPRFNHI